MSGSGFNNPSPCQPGFITIGCDCHYCNASLKIRRLHAHCLQCEASTPKADMTDGNCLDCQDMANIERQAWEDAIQE